jgi:diadenylate cyclase
MSIFHDGGPLHDGAVTIRGDRIAAAGCFLPLSTNLEATHGLGSRHRAALGLAERTDAVVVVVSKERGTISLAEGTALLPDLTREQVKALLTRKLAY